MLKGLEGSGTLRGSLGGVFLRDVEIPHRPKIKPWHSLVDINRGLPFHSMHPTSWLPCDLEVLLLSSLVFGKAKSRVLSLIFEGSLGVNHLRCPVLDTCILACEDLQVLYLARVKKTARLIEVILVPFLLLFCCLQSLGQHPL